MWQAIVVIVGLLILGVGIFLLFGEISATMILEEGKPIREINLAQMEQIRHGQLTVYFPSEHKALGEEVAQALERSWGIVQERLGLDLGRFGVVVVVPKAGEEVGGVSLRRRGIWTLWDPIIPLLTSPELKSIHQADTDTLIAVYWAMAHEAMELKVLKKLYHDRASRWIGDGLAEYMGYTITSELAPQIRNEILAKRRQAIQVGLVDQGHVQYDLTKEFLVIIGTSKDAQTIAQTLAQKTKPADPGYGVSLAFWLQIAQKHGEGVIKTFWERISQRGFPNAREAARILSELTGEDIWTKLQTMDLQDVLRTLEAAASRP